MNDQGSPSEEEALNKKHLIATLVIWLGIAVFAWFLFAPKALHLQALSLLPEPQLAEIDLEALQLTRAFDPERRFVLVFFGFTYCPDVCPTEMNKLAQAVKKIKEKLPDQLPPLVFFVSVDPERDKVDSLKQYVEHFDPEFIGVTGKNALLADVAKFFGAPYSRSVTIDGEEYLVEAGADMPEKAGMDYTVNHSSRIYVIDSMGRYVGSFPPPHDVDVIVADMVELMAQ
jgi:protein SCO1/2